LKLGHNHNARFHNALLQRSTTLESTHIDVALEYSIAQGLGSYSGCMCRVVIFLATNAFYYDMSVDVFSIVYMKRYGFFIYETCLRS
jgi:hypothetical protein